MHWGFPLLLPFRVYRNRPVSKKSAQTGLGFPEILHNQELDDAALHWQLRGLHVRNVVVRCPQQHIVQKQDSGENERYLMRQGHWGKMSIAEASGRGYTCYPKIAWPCNAVSGAV